MKVVVDTGGKRSVALHTLANQSRAESFRRAVEAECKDSGDSSGIPADISELGLSELQAWYKERRSKQQEEKQASSQFAPPRTYDNHDANQTIHNEPAGSSCNRLPELCIPGYD